MEGFPAVTSCRKSGDVLGAADLFLLVIFAPSAHDFRHLLVAFGSKIETDISFLYCTRFSPSFLLMWTVVRWVMPRSPALR